MFWELFKYENRIGIKNILYKIFIIVFVVFVILQLSDEFWKPVVQKPVPDQNVYSTQLSFKEDDIMEVTMKNLLGEVVRNSFSTYPFGGYKEVVLEENNLEKIKKLLENRTGKSYEQLENAYFENVVYDSEKEEDVWDEERFSLILSSGYTYGEFEQDMEKVCDLIGGGSSYEKENYGNGVKIAMGYEEAVEQYNALVQKDHVLGAYARVFCDYAGIGLTFMVIFLGIALFSRDKKYKISEIIYAKRCSSITVVLARYVAAAFLALIPVLIVALTLQIYLMLKIQASDVTVDILSFLKYVGVWLIPQILFSLSCSLCLLELLGKVGTVFLQLGWGLYSLYGNPAIVGQFGYNYIPRWNVVGNSTLFFSEMNQFVKNRLLYFSLAIVLLFLSMFIFQLKRSREGNVIG